ncbi:MAG: aspartate carbamoyltransferase catalytic subunit [Rhizomicrobium sp.]
MTSAAAADTILKSSHLLGIEGLSVPEITALLDLAETYVALNRSSNKKTDLLKGRTLINLFFEASTRTQSSFELAGKRLGADVMNMSVKTSSVSKGETLIDTATTLNAMRPDLLVVRHSDSGAAELLSRKLDCCVINAGDGAHEHPTQALLDALTIRRRLGTFEGLIVAICGDVLHSRVARSNIHLLLKMGARVRLIAPRTLLPADADRFGVEIFHDMKKGLQGADIVMMLRLQLERMSGAFVPSTREYFHFYGLDHEKLELARPGAIVMHPGPMNRGVEIDSAVADDIEVSVIQEQVEMGVAIRMAVLDALSRGLAVEGRNAP